MANDEQLAILKKGVRAWALARYSLVIAVLTWGGAIMLYPGGTVLDASSHGYSFTHNFLSDLGSTVAFNDARNLPGAVLFAAGILIGVAVLAGIFVGTIRLLSAEPRARWFARFAACVGILTCAGFLGVALTPADRAFHLHMVSGIVAFRSFPVATALLGIATLRDGRFRVRATVGWALVTTVLVAFILMVHLGPSAATEHGLVTQVITQKTLVLTVLGVLWLQSVEAEVVSGDAKPEAAPPTSPVGKTTTTNSTRSLKK